MRRATLAVVACAYLAVQIALAKILWENCDGPADDPTVKEGNYYNLCIQDHEFVGESHPWTFTKTVVRNTVFDKCTFTNTVKKTSNYSLSTWENVVFKSCSFGSLTDAPQLFERVAFRKVEFVDCVFDKSAELLFSRFGMAKVNFTNCLFASNTLFELGQMNKVNFNRCSFKRSRTAKTVSGDKKITFEKLTARDSGFKDSEFVTPFHIQSVAAADLYFNDTVFNQFWCHEKPKKPSARPRQLSAFNDTVFQRTLFRDDINCPRTTWRGFTMLNVTFQKDADFSRSNVQDLYWDEIKMKAIDGKTCHKLDFSNSQIFRKVLANISIACEADFSFTRIETLFISGFNAGKANFNKAVFVRQEYVDGQCCTRVCKPLKCLCNITDPSKQCPEGDYTVNLNKAASCFPADATVSTQHGVVRMDELEHGHRVAVGAGAHSDVFFFGHRARDRYALFISITHSGSNSPLRVSPDHYIYASGRLTTANSVRIGDFLRDAHGRDALKVIRVEYVTLRGLYAPTSLHGDMVVDGVLVSSYTSVIHPRLAHFMLHPLRLLYRCGMGRVVRNFNVFEETSMEYFPRAIGLPRGPKAIAA